MFARTVILFSAIAASGLPGSSLADDSIAGWDRGFTLAPYGWLAGVDGAIGTASADLDPGGDIGFPARVDISVDGELEQIGFMFYGDWRGERWTVFFDSVWVNVAQNGKLGLSELLPASNARAGIDGNIYQLAGGYRLFSNDLGSIAVYGGARYYDIEAEASVNGGLLPQGLSATATQDWTDLVAGVRWNYEFAERWGGFILADIGVGDSDTSWQVFATLGYRLSDWGSVVAGYRYLSLDYDTSTYLVDLAMSGPAVGFAFHF